MPTVAREVAVAGAAAFMNLISADSARGCHELSRSQALILSRAPLDDHQASTMNMIDKPFNPVTVSFHTTYTKTFTYKYLSDNILVDN